MEAGPTADLATTSNGSISNIANWAAIKFQTGFWFRLNAMRCD